MTEKRDTFYRPADLPELRVGKSLQELELEPGSYQPIPRGTATGLTIAYERVVRHEAELTERLRCALVILGACGTYDVRTKEALIQILEGSPAVPVTL